MRSCNGRNELRITFLYSTFCRQEKVLLITRSRVGRSQSLHGARVSGPRPLTRALNFVSDSPGARHGDHKCCCLNNILLLNTRELCCLQHNCVINNISTSIWLTSGYVITTSCIINRKRGCFLLNWYLTRQRCGAKLRAAGATLKENYVKKVTTLVSTGTRTRLLPQGGSVPLFGQGLALIHCLNAPNKLPLLPWAI